MKLNVAFIGDSGVGKTSIITRYIFSKFSREYSSTIEDFHSTIVRLNSTSIKLKESIDSYDC